MLNLLIIYNIQERVNLMIILVLSSLDSLTDN